MKRLRWNRGKHAVPLLKSQILEAQENTLSAFEAARYLNVSYKTYVKYAKMYGVFEQHKNQAGHGIRKGISYTRGHKLEEILEGNHPTYKFKNLKDRLIRAGLLEEECRNCGFKERRLTDFRMPILLVALDGNQKNHLIENLALLCYNCAYLNFGGQYNIASYHIEEEDDEPFIQEHPDSIYSQPADIVDSLDDDSDVPIVETGSSLDDLSDLLTPTDLDLLKKEIEIEQQLRKDKG